MKTRQLKYTERLLSKPYPDGRTISVGGRFRAINGGYRIKVGVAICNKCDKFEERVAYDKTLGRAKSKRYATTLDVKSVEDIDRALLSMADNVHKGIVKKVERPYIIPATL